MATVINMPRLSDTMEEGTVATWLKKVGDKVEEGDILAEIETDKATMEFESFHDGILLHIGIPEGETAKVDTLLAIIGEEDEDVSSLLSGEEVTSKTEETNTSSDESTSDTGTQTTSQSESSSISTGDANSELPEGVEIITMPRLSDTMEEGTVAAWLKQEGDTIEEGEILAEIETDKATMEFESFYNGTLLKIGIAEGETAKVDALLAIVGPKGTDVSGITGTSAKPEAPKKEEIPVKVETKKEAVEEKTTPKTTVVSSSNSDKRIFASPLAKKMAEDKGISLAQVQGSGENGRIVKSDIESYQPQVVGAAAYNPVGTESFEDIKNSQMRKTIAKRLGESKFTAPHYYLTVELDMDNAIASRAAINSDPEVKISFNDMIVKACAMALRKHPQVNSQWTGDTTRIANHIHIGVAVAVDEGLLVPVLKFADQMTFSQIGVNVKDLAGKARSKKITPQEMDGSTFTVSNLGMFGIKEFTSIINAPNSAILSVGAIIQKPVVKNGAIAVGNTMTVTLACDHRTVDGATGAKFLQTLRNYIENPVTMFV
ncbi:pyruvate dehydrogenase complex dihydrolipoamide acetyltransferase [Patiriisocius sp. Uisw_017]|jgi:pyruvate dehydrogenase E2 component (dihydrolipoamide acetyltransferase)|uniref:pyruvate dehydrogenase complex dihydrolipoamide acetyltransferase n=1 Tax=Patiriisocius sp. Uisw_017 TaxID=3230968 RepID=UPI0039EBC6E2